MDRALIIGYGNPLRGDDRLGWLVAMRLARTLWSDDVEVLACHQLTIELAEPISRANLIVFVDVRYDGTPGQLICQPVEPCLASSWAFSHYLEPGALLACAQRLYGAAGSGYVLSITGESYEFDQELSPSVMAALPALLDRLHELIAEV